MILSHFVLPNMLNNNGVVHVIHYRKVPVIGLTQTIRGRYYLADQPNV